MLRILLVAFFMLLLVDCDNRLSDPQGNQAPTTTIANVPSDGDTISGLSVLHWDGGDNDGYIQGYEYRYLTEYLGEHRGESEQTDWVFTKNVAETIAFNSRDTLNEQYFEVRSIDNVGDVDPTPATKTIYTYPTARPEVTIMYPAEGTEFLALEQTSDWWRGVRVEVEGFDSDGEIREFGWAVDGGDWQWTSDTIFHVPPGRLQSPLEGEHEILVTARDNTNLLSSSPESLHVNLMKPTFSKKLLIIDGTTEDNFASGIPGTDAEVDSFYREVFPGGDSWDYAKHHALPPQSVLGDYKAIVWHGDNPISRGPHNLADHTDQLSEYLNVGGNLVVTGKLMLKSFRPDQEMPHDHEPGSFIHDYLHIAKITRSPPYPGDLTGVIGSAGFPDSAMVDSTMLKRNTFYNGKGTSIEIVMEAGNFTSEIFGYLNDDENLHMLGYRGATCGMIYYGTSFNTVTLGFPLWHLQEEAVPIGREILKKLNLE